MRQHLSWDSKDEFSSRQSGTEQEIYKMNEEGNEGINGHAPNTTQGRHPTKMVAWEHRVHWGKSGEMLQHDACLTPFMVFAAAVACALPAQGDMSVLFSGIL